MVLYDRITERLIEQEATSEDPQTYFLSIYYPVEHHNKEETKKRLKSLVHEGFRDHSRFSSNTELKHLVVETINKNVDNLESLGMGLAIFMKLFAAADRQRETKIDPADVTFLPLTRTPRREITLERVYDLDQFVWLSSQYVRGLALNIHQDACDIYQLEDVQIRHLETVKNIQISQKEPEYLEKFSTVVGTRGRESAYHGTGSDNVQRRIDQENRLFIKAILSQARHYQKKNDEYFYIVLAYSNKFAFLSEQLNEEFKALFPNASILHLQKTLKQESALKKEVLELIEEHQRKEFKESFQKAQEDPTFVTGWRGVTDGVRVSKLETLFIDPTYQKKGFLLDKRYPYLSKIENARPVNNLGVWIVREVLKSGGKVNIMPENKNSIAAKLRY